MYDKLGPNNEDYADMRPFQGVDALVTDAFNRTFEIFVEEYKICLEQAVEDAVVETLMEREGPCPMHPIDLEAELKSELRRSPLVQDALPRRHAD